MIRKLEKLIILFSLETTCSNSSLLKLVVLGDDAKHEEQNILLTMLREDSNMYIKMLKLLKTKSCTAYPVKLHLCTLDSEIFNFKMLNKFVPLNWRLNYMYRYIYFVCRNIIQPWKHCEVQYIYISTCILQFTIMRLGKVIMSKRWQPHLDENVSPRPPIGFHWTTRQPSHHRAGCSKPQNIIIHRHSRGVVHIYTTGKAAASPKTL